MRGDEESWICENQRKERLKSRFARIIQKKVILELQE